MNIYLIIILFAIIMNFLLHGLAEYMNIKALTTDLPEEFRGYYDQDKYASSQEYTKAQTKFDLFSSSFNTLLILMIIIFGGFNYLDIFVRGFNLGPVLTGLIFFGILFVLQDIVSIPFSLYNNFVLEQRFGFNQMTLKTFVTDKIKTYLLSIIIGSILAGGILFFFEKTGQYAWLYAWLTITFFIIIAQPFFNTVIAPMFNKFTPLEKGELKEAISAYAQKVNFSLKDISIMDGSRRSSHSNAYFSGFLKKRIALFDTLIKNHSKEEIVAVIAHEIGHYKKHHVIKGMIIAILHSGILFYLLSFFINNRGLFNAFQMQHISIYGGLVFFGLLYSPIEIILAIFMNAWSRKHEYEADNFAAKTTGDIRPMIIALKNLSVSNLSNLTPHPLNVFLNYSHPPVLERIRGLEKTD